jgi:DNA polymerase III psi subunit
MMLTKRQHSVLADIGISVWQRRQQAQPVAQNTASAEPVINTADAMLLVIVDEALDDSKQLLLGAMLKAVGLTSDQVATLNSQQLSAQSDSNKPLLILGDMPLPEIQAQPHRCPGLDEMLQQAQRKAHAWQTLQKLKLVL